MRGVLTPSTYVTTVVQAKKSTRLLKASCQLKKVRASEGTCRWGPSLCDNNAWEFRVGAYVGALGRLEEQRAISPEDCRDKRPWNRNCVEDVLRMASDAMAYEDTIPCMTIWSFEAPTKIKPKFTECPRDSQEDSMLERWNSVGCVRRVLESSRQERSSPPWQVFWLECCAVSRLLLFPLRAT